MLKLIFILAICSIFNPISYAEENSASITINTTTREIIQGENFQTPMAIASTTKIMTAILTIENSSSTDIFTVSENAQNQEGSSVYLRSGQKITQKELLYALMLNSGNDAAMTLAENIGGNLDTFIMMMNEKAKSIGCNNTNFKNPSGLPASNHYSTAYDLAIMTAYAMESDYFRDIVNQKEFQIKTDSSITYLRNHNKLLWKYPYCIGGKTGYTKEAGRCLVSCAEKNGKSIINVTLNHPDDWNDHINYSESAFECINNIKISEKYSILTTKKINGIPTNLLTGDDIILPLADRNKNNLCCKIKLKDLTNKDIKIFDEIGVADIYYKSHLLCTVTLLSGQNIKQNPKNIFNKNLNYIFKKMILKGKN